MQRQHKAGGSILLGSVIVLLLLAAGTFGLLQLRPATALQLLQRALRWHAGLQVAALDVADVRISYLDGGHGEPLLLIHGFGADKDNFTPLAARLTSSYRVIIPDMPGFGDSSKSLDIRYSIDDQVQRLHAFVQALQLKTLSLGGNSMGGWLAGAYAAKYPQEVRSLWLIDPAGVASAPQSELMRRVLSAPPGHSPMVVASVEDLQALMPLIMARPPRLPRAFLEVMVARSRADAPLLEKVLQQSLASTPLEERVQGLTTPTLIVWGDRDRAVDIGGAEILHARMPNSQLRIMAGIGHVPMLEDAAQTARDYLAFRATLKPPVEPPAPAR